MSDPFMGMVIQVGFNFAPVGWHACDGSILPISQNTALFSLLGTMYGGNGMQTFGLPDLRSRVVIGAGQGPGLSLYQQGQTGGQEHVSLTSSQLPMHTHPFNVSSTKASAQVPAAGGTIGHSKDGATTPTSVPEIYCPGGTALDTMLATGMVGNAGNSQPVPTIPPYQSLLYIVCMQGIYPSRQ